MSAKKILFITNQLPYPPTTGGKLKSWNLVRFLSQNYNLSLAYLIKKGEKEDEQEMLLKLNLFEHHSEELDIPRSGVNLVKSRMLSDTLNVFRNHSKTFFNKVSELCKKTDLIIVDHYEMYPYVEHSHGIKKILHEHNAEYCLWERMGQLEKSPIKSIVLKSESKRIKKAELKYVKNADLVWAAPNDILELTQQGADGNKFEYTYHLGDDKFIDLPDIEFERTQRNIVFVGTQSWEANIDGLVWFFEKCWPILKKKEKDIKVFIIGKDPQPRVTKFGNNDPDIVFTGFVKNLEDHYSTARVSIVPLRFGSGMKVKLLSSLFRGIPTVTTSIGAEGIDLENGKNIFINDDEESFVESIITLLNNKNVWVKFRNNSRILVRNKYTWESLLAKHKREIDKLMSWD